MRGRRLPGKPWALLLGEAPCPLLHPEAGRALVRTSHKHPFCRNGNKIGREVEGVYGRCRNVEASSPAIIQNIERKIDLAGGDGGLKQRNPGIAQALFRSGMVEQYGTSIPRIKRYCDAEGVKFSYRRTRNSRNLSELSRTKRENSERLIVLQVEHHFLLWKQVVTTRHLGQTGKARGHHGAIMPAVDTLLELGAERRAFRTRSDKRHPFCQDEKTRLPAEMLRLDS